MFEIHFQCIKCQEKSPQTYSYHEFAKYYPHEHLLWWVYGMADIGHHVKIMSDITKVKLWLTIDRFRLPFYLNGTLNLLRNYLYEGSMPDFAHIFVKSIIIIMLIKSAWKVTKI